MSSFPSSPWPPPPPPPLLVPTSGGLIQPMAAAVPSSSSASHSFSPSLLIIAAILLFVFLACITIHLILRLFSSRSSSSSSRVFSSSSIDQFHFTPESESTEEENNNENNKPDALIDALPLFTLGSSLATLPKSSPDCAVCLSPFDLTSELRLLPACRHAFHSHCIDTWLRSTPSCPLCRASVRLPFPPLPCTDGRGHNRTESFRIEIGSISRRRTDENPSSASGRSYSIGSFDYRIEDEIDAVVARITRVKEEKDAEMAAPRAPPPPGDHIAELAGGDGRGWLRDYVDRLTSSASSSFNSLRFSGRRSARWSHRPEISTAAPDSRQWDVEAASLAEDGEAEAFYAVYRWIVGV